MPRSLNLARRLLFTGTMTARAAVLLLAAVGCTTTTRGRPPRRPRRLYAAMFGVVGVAAGAVVGGLIGDRDVLELR